MAHGYARDRDEILSRLRKIEGQVRGLQRMVEQDSYCVDILTQISAVVSGVEKVGLRLFSDHVRGCVADALDSPEVGEEKVEELLRVVERFVKT